MTPEALDNLRQGDTVAWTHNGKIYTDTSTFSHKNLKGYWVYDADGVFCERKWVMTEADIVSKTTIYYNSFAPFKTKKF